MQVQGEIRRPHFTGVSKFEKRELFIFSITCHRKKVKLGQES